VYDISYTYDPLGNRKTRIDAIADRKTVYHYDTDADNPFALEFPSRHNRLLYYELFDTSGQSDVLLRTVRYTYYATGNVSNITIKDEWIEGVTPGEPGDYDVFHDLALHYYTNGQLWRAHWGKWKNYPESSRPDPATYQPLGVREFRDDDPTERYLVTDFDSGVADPNTIWPARRRSTRSSRPQSASPDRPSRPTRIASRANWACRAVAPSRTIGLQAGSFSPPVTRTPILSICPFTTRPIACRPRGSSCYGCGGPTSGSTSALTPTVGRRSWRPKLQTDSARPISGSSSTHCGRGAGW
jgi:hypothetical protein